MYIVLVFLRAFYCNLQPQLLSCWSKLPAFPWELRCFSVFWNRLSVFTTIMLPKSTTTNRLMMMLVGIPSFPLSWNCHHLYTLCVHGRNHPCKKTTTKKTLRCIHWSATALKLLRGVVRHIYHITFQCSAGLVSGIHVVLLWPNLPEHCCRPNTLLHSSCITWCQWPLSAG